ncbi:ABC transporter substrate-binding protein, partial [Lactonifactor longoviformis]
FKNEKYDSLYQEIKKTTDDARQVELYKEMETILAEDAANVYIEDMACEVALNPEYDGYVFYPLYVQDMAKIYKIKE